MKVLDTFIKGDTPPTLSRRVLWLDTNTNELKYNNNGVWEVVKVETSVPDNPTIPDIPDTPEGDTPKDYTPKYTIYRCNIVEGGYYDSKVVLHEFNNGVIEIGLNMDYSGNTKEGKARIIIEYTPTIEDEWVKTSKDYTYDENTGIITIKDVNLGDRTTTGYPMYSKQDVLFQLLPGGERGYIVNEYLISPNNRNTYVMGTEAFILEGIN